MSSSITSPSKTNQTANLMKLSNRTVQILKKFVNINQSIQFRKGSEVSTLAIQKNVLARAPVTEEFPRDFAIYDLGEFVQVLDLSKMVT